MRRNIILVEIALLSIIVENSLFAQWTQTAGPSGGAAIYSLTVSGTVLYAGTEEGSVYVSTDLGSSWRGGRIGMTNPDWVNSLTAVGNALLAATKEGVFASTDRGLHWSKSDSGLPDTDVISLTTTDSSTVMAGTRDGHICRSTDHGAHWAASDLQLSNAYVNSFLVSGSRLYAATYGASVLRSTNSGATWDSASVGLADWDHSAYVNALCAVGTDLFAATYNGVYVSTDLGATWTSRSSGITENLVSSIASVGGYIIAGTYGGGLFRTSDSGVTWIPANSGARTPYLRALVTVDSSVFVATSGGGVQRSTDFGMSWGPSGTGMIFTWAWALAGVSSRLYCGTNGSGMFVSTNAGVTWSGISTGLQDPYSLSIAFIDTLIFVGAGHGVYRSSDAGQSWNLTGLTSVYVDALAVLGKTIIAGSNDDGVHVSTDDGETWTISPASLTNPYVNSLAVYKGLIFAGTNGGVFVSADTGASWTNIGLSPDWVMALAVADSFLVAGSGEFSRAPLNGYGYDWTGGNHLSGEQFNCFVVNEHRLVAGTNNGVYVSTNCGDTWSDLSQGLNLGAGVYSLCVVDSTIYAGCLGTGVWKRPFAEMVASSRLSSAIQPEELRLMQNYPNPFNPTTGIRFQLSGNSWVRLVVYDLLGKEVAVLVNERKSPGSYEVRFNGSRLSSGVYFYELTAGTSRIVRSMVLAK